MTPTPVSVLGWRPVARLGLTFLIVFAAAACASPPSNDSPAVSASPPAEPQAPEPVAQVESSATAVSLPSASSTTNAFPTVEPEPEVPAAAPAESDSPETQVLTALLRDAYQFRLLNAPQLAVEIARLERLERLQPTAEHRLRWALALAQTLQIQDTQRALGLIQTVLESPDTQSVFLRPLAHLLGHLLREQRRLDLQNERLSQQARENQRRVEQLNDRIEAMRAIERSLNRSVPLTTPSRSIAP